MTLATITSFTLPAAGGIGPRTIAGRREVAFDLTFAAYLTDIAGRVHPLSCILIYEKQLTLS